MYYLCTVLTKNILNLVVFVEICYGIHTNLYQRNIIYKISIVKIGWLLFKIYMDQNKILLHFV